jgi:hypothetical protein
MVSFFRLVVRVDCVLFNWMCAVISVLEVKWPRTNHRFASIIPQDYTN